jgi:drug/metabolite transporter (DMT)-like permease
MTGRFWGISAALLSVFFWSTYSIFSKYLLQFTIPETLILISQIFTIISVLLFFGLLPELKDIRKLDRKSLFALFLITLFSSVLAPLLFLKWLSQTLAINAIVTSRLSSVFVWLLGFFWLKEVFTRKWLLGTLMMFVWILCITTQWFSLGFQVDVGVLYVACWAVASALGSVIYKKFLGNVKTEVVILVRYIIAFTIFIFLVPIMLNVNHEVSIWFQENTRMYFLWLALIPLLAATYLWYEALDHLPASLVWALDLLVPFSWMVLAYIFLNEWLYMYHLRGSLFLLAGLWINLMKSIRYTPGESIKRLLLFKRNH